MARARLVVLVCGLVMACGTAAQVWTPPVQQRDKDIAAETGGQVGDFPDAVMTGPAGTEAECTVAIRVMKAGSMTSIVSGVKLTAVTLDEHGHPVPGGTGESKRAPVRGWARWARFTVPLCMNA